MIYQERTFGGRLLVSEQLLLELLFPDRVGIRIRDVRILPDLMAVEMHLQSDTSGSGLPMVLEGERFPDINVVVTEHRKTTKIVEVTE